MGHSAKITLIGGGGKIATAVTLELLQLLPDTPLELVLWGRNAAKLARAQTLAARFNSGSAVIRTADSLDDALRGADIVLYCATWGHADFEGLRSMGIANGAHILHVGERVQTLCPDAWLLVVTNPPDIPLSALRMRLGLTRLLGLCNAPVFSRRMLASFLGCEEERIDAYEIGVNHEYWYYDIRMDGKSIYDLLRRQLPEMYDPAGIQGPFHSAFPEWKHGFINNVELLRLTGWLSGPVGGSNRYGDMPVSHADMWAQASRPTDADYMRLENPALPREEILRVTRRCAAGIPQYVAQVLASIVTDDGRPHHVLAFNDGVWGAYPDDVMLQMRCGVRKGGLSRPVPGPVPAYIEAVLASRIRQNHLAARALAAQDDALLTQALLVYPERVPVREADAYLQRHASAEPAMQLN